MVAPFRRGLAVNFASELFISNMWNESGNDILFLANFERGPCLAHFLKTLLRCPAISRLIGARAFVEQENANEILIVAGYTTVRVGVTVV